MTKEFKKNHRLKEEVAASNENMEPDAIPKQIENLKSKQQLTRKERRYLQKLENKLSEKKDSNKPFNIKQVLAKISIIILVLLVIAGIMWFVASRPNLPPIDLAGHIEQNPSAHILDQPMPELIQKHMLEHADGKGKSGILIQYNCKKYSCEKNLIDKLKTLVKKYPENVYLAPNNYDGKIIITKLNQRKILSSFDEGQIVDFITNK